MPAARDRTRQLAIRLPTSLVDRLDAHAERMRAQARGVRVTRADALRSLLLAALDTVEIASK